MRSFIAIELPESLNSALSGLQRELKKSGADVRWVRPEGIHLTLKFLGNIEEKRADAVINVLKRTCSGYRPFELNVAGIGVFPNIKSPRVIWVGIEINDSLMSVQKEIDSELLSLDFEMERRKFAPHLTLGRFRSMKGKRSLQEKIRLNEELVCEVIQVKSLSLMRSELCPEGVKYTRLAEVPLGQLPS